MVIGKEAVLTALEEDVLDEEFDTVDVLLSSEADEVVTSALFTVVELSLPPLLAPQAVATATASAIGITTFNRFFALINVLSLMRFYRSVKVNSRISLITNEDSSAMSRLNITNS
jgi:hypothetical protein